MVLTGPYVVAVIELGSAICKENILPAELSLKLQFFFIIYVVIKDCWKHTCKKSLNRLSLIFQNLYCALGGITKKSIQIENT